MTIPTVPIIEVNRDPLSTDVASTTAIIGTTPMWTLTPGTLWHNTVSGAVFACVNPAAGTWQQVGLLLDSQKHLFTNVQAADAAVAPTAAQSGSRFVCTNAGATTVTLPAVAEGLVYQFLRAADEEMVVASAEGDNMLVGDDAEADSITFTTAGEHIGALVQVEGILVGADAKWLTTVIHVPIGTGLAFHAYSLAS